MTEDRMVSETRGDAEAAAGSPPDWNALKEEIHCPLCDYNLRGLVNPQCPECGYRFAWGEVADWSRQKHPYLFEHHPERNVRSFFQTMIGGLRPRKFWKTLHPAQPSRPWRLAVYVLAILAFAVAPLAEEYILGQRNRPFRVLRWGGWSPWSTWTILLFGPPDELTWQTILLRPLYYAPLSHLVYMGVGALSIWPLFTFALLSIFQASRRKARLRIVHQMRCVVYSCDALLWIAPVAAILVVSTALSVKVTTITIISFPRTNIFSPLAEPFAWTILVGMPLLWLLMSYRLAVAYKLYLRFSHPFWTILSTQIIVLLVAAVMLFVYSQS